MSRFPPMHTELGANLRPHVYDIQFGLSIKMFTNLKH